MKIELYNIPSVDQHVNRMISDFLKLSSDLSQGDILLADRINKLLEKSRYMLKNIDNFMNKNSLDPRVAYLYVTRNKLFKFIQKVQQNKLVKQVNSIQASQSMHSDHKSLPHQDLLNNSRQILLNSKDRTKFEDVQHKSKANGKQNQAQTLNNLQEFSSFQRKQPFFSKNFKKPDPIKIQPESPVVSKAKPLQTKSKSSNPELQKSSYDLKKPKQIPKIRTPIKTSKKLESFTPAKISSNKLGNENGTEMKSSREAMKEGKGTGVFERSGRKNGTPESKGGQKTERSSKKGTGEKMIAESHLYSEYSNGGKGRGKGEEASSAIKNLSNLIFTIKMTREEYNEFKKIKEEHEGKLME